MKNTIFFVVLLTITALVYGMDWPVDPSQSRLLANFGSVSQSSALVGENYAASGPVKAAADGEVVFSRTGNERFSRLPSPLGVWTVCDHGDGLFAIYARLDGGNKDEPPLPSHVNEGMAVGQAGKSGWAGQEGFFFAFYDRKEKRYVNPASLLPARADTSPPVIQAVFVRPEGSGEAEDEPKSALVPLTSTLRTLPQGRYSIFVQAYDMIVDLEANPAARSGLSQLCPYRFQASINGTEAGSVTFETLQTKDGSLMVFRGSLVPMRQIYGSGSASDASICQTGVVTLNRGLAALDILVSDISANSRAASFKILVE